jgi:hypothetical protein
MEWGRKLGMVLQSCHPNCSGNKKNSRIAVRAGQPRQKARPYLQNNHSKKGEVMAQVLDHLTSKSKALSSNPSTTKKKKKRKKKRKERKNYCCVEIHIRNMCHF